MQLLFYGFYLRRDYIKGETEFRIQKLRIQMSRSFWWWNIVKFNLWREAWVWVLFCELVVELSKVGHHRKFVRTKKRTIVKEVSMFFRTLFWMKSCLDTWTKSSTSRSAGIPSSFSATPKARAQFLGMRLTLKVKVLAWRKVNKLYKARTLCSCWQETFYNWRRCFDWSRLW